MKKIFTTICMGVAVLSINAQSVERSALTSSGGPFQAGGLSGGYTLGDLMVETLDAGSNIFLAQGFVQPEAFVDTRIELSSVPDKISIYPNPAINYINIKLTDIEAIKVTVKMIDITGKLRTEKDFEVLSSNVEFQIDIKDLHKGIYFVSVFEGENLLKRTKIYKK